MHFMCLKAGIIKDAEGSFIYKQRGGPMLPAFLLPWRYFPSNKNGTISLGWWSWHFMTSVGWSSIYSWVNLFTKAHGTQFRCIGLLGPFTNLPFWGVESHVFWLSGMYIYSRLTADAKKIWRALTVWSLRCHDSARWCVFWKIRRKNWAIFIRIHFFQLPRILGKSVLGKGCLGKRLQWRGFLGPVLFELRREKQSNFHCTRWPNGILVMASLISI